VSSIWHVLCPGPSLRRLRADQFRPVGPVVAVNNAVLHPVAHTVWAVQDQPERFEHVWRSLDSAGRAALGPVWCRERSVAAWRAVGLGTWPHPETEAEFRARLIPTARPGSPPFQNLTVMMAVTRAIALGATAVEVFGADMGPAGYACGVDPMGRTPAQWDARWKTERGLWDLALQEWERAGATVRRVP
jgi:hypothetical protein